jgi:hypothetical protein
LKISVRHTASGDRIEPILTVTMAKRRESLGRSPERIAPADAPGDAVERVAPRRAVLLRAGDVVVARERVPILQRRGAPRDPLWRYRVFIHPHQHEGLVFSSFQHAASEGEQMASAEQSQLLYLEEGVVTLLAASRNGNAK